MINHSNVASAAAVNGEGLMTAIPPLLLLLRGLLLACDRASRLTVDACRDGGPHEGQQEVEAAQHQLGGLA